LASLERQARRTQEHEQLRADLQLLLREWYGYHWHEAQQEVAEAQATVHIQEERLSRVQAEQAETARLLDKLRQQIQQLRTRVDGWHRELSDLYARREAASRDLAVSQEREHSIIAQQESIQRQTADLEEEALFQEELAKLAEQELGSLQEELEDAAAQAETAGQALEKRRVERSRVEKLVQVARQELASLSARQGQLQAHLGESRAQIERVEKALETVLQALERAEKDHQSADAAHLAAGRALEAMEAGLRAADERLSTCRKRLVEVEGRRKSASDERAGFAAEAARLKARLDVLEQAEAALTGYASGTRLLLQASRQKRLSGARGALISFLEAPAQI
jgi:chromosome segregation protein